MTGEPFVIATNVPEFDDPMMSDVNNLCYRLKIQQEQVLKTESTIEDMLKIIIMKKGFPESTVDKIIELLSWTISDSRCRKSEIYREVCLYLSHLSGDDEIVPAEAATAIRKKIR